MDTQDVTNEPKYYIIKGTSGEEDIALQVDLEGNVVHWDENRFLEICEELKQDQPLFHLLLAVFNLGAISSHFGK